jgi:ATP-binding cassette subfamily B protein
VPGLHHIARRFWPQIRQQGWLVGGASMALVVEVLVRLAEPWPLKFVFDRLVPVGRDVRGAAATELGPGTLLALCALAVVALALARAGASYVSRVAFSLAGNRILTQCRGELFAHLQRLSLRFHSRSRTGDLITRVTGDIGRLKDVVITALLPMVAHSIMLAGMAVVMLIIDWRLGLVALAIVPLFALCTRRLGRSIRQVARRQRQREGEIGATAAEALVAMKVVQSLSLEGVHERSFSARNRASLKEGVQGTRLSARLASVVDVLIALATAAVLWWGAVRVIDGALTPGDLIVFLAYLKNAFKPLRDVAKYSGRVAGAAASAERVLEVFDVTPLVVDRPGAEEAPLELTRLRFEDLGFCYEPGRPVLERFNLEGTRGQVIALAGPSGAGKSTVLSLLLRLYDPTSGRITLDGRDIRAFTLKSLRARVAVVPQENVLFAVSIRDNIACGAPEATHEDVVRAARLANADGFIAELPLGYDTVVGERGQMLSEGQRQRIAIARAVVRGAPILVFDEPTASLDNDNNRLIRQALRTLSRDRLCIVVAHDLSTVEEADAIFYLAGGRVLERGTHAELMQRNGSYAAMYALQARGRARLEEVHAR